MSNWQLSFLLLANVKCFIRKERYNKWKTVQTVNKDTFSLPPCDGQIRPAICWELLRSFPDTHDTADLALHECLQRHKYAEADTS